MKNFMKILCVFSCSVFLSSSVSANTRVSVCKIPHWKVGLLRLAPQATTILVHQMLVFEKTVQDPDLTPSYKTYLLGQQIQKAKKMTENISSSEESWQGWILNHFFFQEIFVELENLEEAVVKGDFKAAQRLVLSCRTLIS